MYMFQSYEKQLAQDAETHARRTVSLYDREQVQQEDRIQSLLPQNENTSETELAGDDTDNED